MPVSRGKARKEIITFVETEDITVPMDENNKTSLKELRELVAATSDLPDSTVVQTDGDYNESDSSYWNYLKVKTGYTWEDYIKEWELTESEYHDSVLEGAELAIVTNLGIDASSFVEKTDLFPRMLQ